MSNKNRAQRQGFTAGTALNSGTTLTGPMSEFFGGIGGGAVTPSTRTSLIERMVTRKLMQISMSRFKWSGLPDTVNERWLNLALLGNALAVFFQDPDTGQFFATNGTPYGNYNMVGDPTAFQAVAANGLKHWVFDVDHCVPIWANELRWPDLDIIQVYAHRIAETDRTIEINLKNSRQPKVLAYPENLRLSLANFNDQVEKGNAAVQVTEEFGLALKDMIQVLDMAIHPDLIINTSIMRGRIWYECMELLGINHAPNADKKERLVSAEVESNNEIVTILRETNLKSLQLACEQINTMWPELTVGVEYVVEPSEDPDADDDQAGPGANSDGTEDK